ncbi:MAG: hypothetical protein ABI609_06775 [Acidobacteriota bacterium]
MPPPRRLRDRRRLLAAGLGLALGAALQTPSFAWTPTSQLEIAAEAARLAPPDLARQLLRHEDRFRRGVVDAFHERDAMRHMKNSDGSGTLDRVIVEEADHAVEMIRRHQPFADIAYQLGRVSHFVADADNPLNASQADPIEGTYFADYLFYMQAVEGRFARVFYGADQALARAPGRASLQVFVNHVLNRSRLLYPLIGAEYRRVDQVNGQALFDDRSTAFAVAALSFSHALTDSAAVLRDIWLRSGGGDLRGRSAIEAQRLLVLPPRTLSAG